MIDDRVRRTIQVDSIIVAHRDQIVSDDTAGLFDFDGPRLTAHPGASSAATERKPDMLSRHIPQLPFADHGIALNYVVRTATFHEGTVGCVPFPTANKVGDYVFADVPVAGGDKIDRGDRIGRDPRRGVDDRVSFDYAPIRKPAAFAVDLDLSVEILQPVVADHHVRCAADDVEGVLTIGMVAADPAQVQILEAPMRGGNIEYLNSIRFDGDGVQLGGAE
ncbi:MAG TPA: hypothetical protein VGF36_13740, partial [Rhodopila sp.]